MPPPPQLAINKATMRVTASYAQPCAEAVPPAQDTLTRTNFELRKESLWAFILRYKTPVQIWFTVLKQTSLLKLCSGPDPESQWKKLTPNKHTQWIRSLHGKPKINWSAFKETRKQHTFHFQVKLSQMDLQCPFYKAHVLEERPHSHYDWEATFPNTPFSYLIFKGLWLFSLPLHRGVELILWKQHSFFITLLSSHYFCFNS